MGDPLGKPKTEYYRGARPTTPTFLIVVFVFFSLFVAWLGPTNFLFWYCVVLSAVLAASFCRRLPKRSFVSPVLAVMVVTIVPVFLMTIVSGAMVLNGLLHLLLLVWASRLTLPCTASQVFRKSVTLTLVSFAVAAAIGISPWLNYRAATSDIATIKIADRLEYMDGFRESSKSSQLAIAEQDLSELGLEHFRIASEANQNFFGRERALEQIHNGTIEKFVKSPGFGVGRFLIPTEKDAVLPVLIDIGLGPTVETRGNPDLQGRVHGRFANLYKLANELPELHISSMTDFAHPLTYGFEVQPGKYFGFLEHGFHASPADGAAPMFEEQGLRLKQLQLISLHRFEEPRAYVLDHLPRMDQLSGADVPTRQLDEFELRALQRLPLEKGLVIETESKVTRMLGALPAFDACLECHNVSRGELLGAFSYEFDRE